MSLDTRRQDCDDQDVTADRMVVRHHATPDTRSRLRTIRDGAPAVLTGHQMLRAVKDG
jgi:hypothetical protein